MPEPGPVLGGDVGERLQQVDRDHDQVVEVHRPGRDQPALVLAVGLGQRLLPVPGGTGGERLVVHELVLEAETCAAIAFGGWYFTSRSSSRQTRVIRRCESAWS